MDDIEKMSERLRKELLNNYTSGIKGSIYAEADKTLSCLQKAFTQRGHGGQKRGAVVPLHFVQSICSLGKYGFEDAGGFQKYKKGIPSLLTKVWLLFTTTLIHFVRQQNEDNEGRLFFGCLEIPNWFIKESKSLSVFKYFD